MMNERFSILLAAGTLAGATMIGGASASFAARDDSAAARDVKVDRERDVARERLTRQIEMLRERQEHLEHAIAMLESGAGLVEIHAELQQEPGQGRGGARRGEARGERGGDRPEAGGRSGDRKERLEQMRQRRGEDHAGLRGGGEVRDRVEGRRGGRGMAPALSPEREQHVLDLLGEVNPEVHERLTKLREERPEMARRALSEVGARIHRLDEIRDRDPEAFELRKREMRLGADIATTLREIANMEPESATAAELVAARAKLGDLVSEQFELRLEMKEREIVHIQARLEKVQAELSEQASTRTKLVNERVDELVRRALEEGLLAENNGL